jgi:hypothetical protein
MGITVCEEPVLQGRWDRARKIREQQNAKPHLTRPKVSAARMVACR